MKQYNKPSYSLVARLAGWGICLCLVISWQSVVCQVSVIIPPGSTFEYSIQNLSQVIINNTGSRPITNCYADITCSDVTGNRIFEMKTTATNLAVGNNFLGYTALTSAQVTGGGKIYTIFQQTGALPAGSYTLCVTMYRLGSAQMLGTSCSTVTSSNFGNLYLLSPDDAAIIETEYPNLNWMALNLKGKDVTVKYAIRVCLLQPGQTYTEAIVENPPLVYEQNLNANSFTYPGSAPLLDTSQQYVWQVNATISNGNTTENIYSEIWMFQFGRHSPGTNHKKKKKHTEAKQYPYLTKNLSSTTYSFDKYINFRYNNECRDSLINYTIYSAGDSVPSISNKTYPIILKPRVNYISIPVPKDMQQEAKSAKANVPSQYLFCLHNARKEKWEMKFIIIASSKKKKGKQ